MDNVTLYEQPLNELTRVCLRLEHLFCQMDHCALDTSIFGTHNLIGVIINTLQLLDRPDLKAKLAKELGHQLQSLQRTESAGSELLTQFAKLHHYFLTSSGKISQRLREIELLNTLRLHLATPGGGCSFDIPVYHYWLQQPAAERLEVIQSWITEFDHIRLASSLILRQLKKENKIYQKEATNGFYQELLNPQRDLRLIQVMVPQEIAAYPEISVGRHFLSIRFYSPAILVRPVQYPKNLSFWLSYCVSP